MGLISIISVLAPTWHKAAGLLGGLFLGTAGIIHITRMSEGINLKETTAMISDFFILIIVIVYMFYSVKQSKKYGLVYESKDRPLTYFHLKRSIYNV